MKYAVIIKLYSIYIAKDDYNSNTIYAFIQDIHETGYCWWVRHEPFFW